MAESETKEKAFDVNVNIRVMAISKASAINKVQDLLNQLMKTEWVADYEILEEL